MHTKPMADSEGVFNATDVLKSKCGKCGQVEVTCQTWESSCGGYEDYKYTCGACGHVRWVDGIDS